MLGGGGSGGGPCSGDELLTVTVVKDEHGYGMKVSGDNPVYVQSVKEGGAAWRAGLRAGDRILRVDSVPVHRHTHQQVVHMIRANPTAVLTVHQNASRHKTPITAPLPVNQEKQRQLEASKVHTVRLMLEQEQKYMRDLRNDLSKVPDVRKQAQLESAEQRCSVLQQQIDTIMAGQPPDMSASYPQPTLAPATPRLPARTKNSDKLPGSPPPNSTGFLSGLPRSLSNLTGQSLRNLRQARQNSQKNQQENQPPLVRQNSDDNHKRRHNNTVPMVPTTCLDNTPPPPLPPRSIERPKRSPFNPHSPVNPLAKPKPISPIHKQYYKGPYHNDNKAHSQMHQSMPAPFREDNPKLFRRSSHSLDSDLDGPQPNSIALQMSYPLINAPPPPLKTDNRTGVPVLHVRSQSSPEHLDHGLHRLGGVEEKEAWERGTPPPGTPPPPYAHNTQPCADPQRAIISMEEDDPPSDNSTYSGLFSNFNSVRESKARMAVLLNWLLGERRCACAALLLILTDGYRSAANVTTATLRRWAYEIHSTFLIPNAVLQLSGVDENMANEIEHILVNEYEKEELLRNVFRKARQKAKEELSQQLTEFQVKRQVGLGTLYGPDDALIQKCETDKQQELVVVERIMCAQLTALGGPGSGLGGGAGSPCATSPDALAALLAALHAAALCLSCRPASVSAAAGAARPVFLLRDKPYKQRLKHLAKQNQQPFVIRGHHLQLQALTSVADCHHCDNVVWGLAPQAYVCNDCKLRVHRACARNVEEACCLDHNNRKSWIMDRMHHNQNNHEINHDRRPVKKVLGTAHFIGVERGQRRIEDEPNWEHSPTHAPVGDSRREGSADEQVPLEHDVDPSDVTAKDLPEKEQSRLAAPGGRGVNRAESCRERDAPRRGKHRNASDPNRLTAHNNHDLEPGAVTAPSGSSSNSSLSSRSNESNTVAAEQQASQSDWSEEDEPLAVQWVDSLPPRALDSLLLSARLRKRQEVIHELITSEGSHVRWLKVLGFVFLQPLESQPTLLPQEELRALFPNLPGVRERHAKLYADLKAARSEASNHVVQIRPIADAMLNTLGESGYAACLSKFCRGQRMALEQLRERRRKHKELHQFLTSKEQLPLCGRLQLRDLLACVWQRLTKYQLLLESILKTVCDSDPEPAEDISRLRHALDVAKDVLHGVDTAIRTAENQHRLRTIQSKLEVRASGLEWEELRRLDLTQRALRMEGDLSIRCDSNKKINVLALMLSDSLVLLQREGDKFVLKPISQPSQQGHLSPLIKWDKVLFRPNAAARNTFFLMNINGVQMHELSANTAAEYAMWVKNIQECPLAMTDLKPIITPSHHSTKSNDDSGINVSRNPSDASEKSEKSSSTAHDDNENERDRVSLGRSSTEREDRCERDDRAERDDRVERDDRSEKDEKASLDKEDRVSQDKESVVAEREDRHKPRRPTVGLVSQHGCSPAPLEPSGAVRIAEPAAACLAHTARRAYTHHERLRRLDERISQALRAKSVVVAELLGVDKDAISQVADLAVAETLGQLDVSSELHAARLDRSSSIEDDLPSPEDEGQPPPADMHQLLLAAQAQANQLTEALAKALSVSESSAVAARVGRSGRCDSCRRRQLTRSATIRSDAADQSDTPDQLTDLDDRPLDRTLDKEISFDMLSELDARTEGLDEFESCASAAGLASKLVGVTSGLQSAVGRLLAALPAAEAERRALRRELAALREANDALRARHARAPPIAADDYEMTEEMCFPKESVDRVIQDQPSNGG